MKVYKSMREYLKTKGYITINYFIENGKIYSQFLNNDKIETDSLVFIKKINKKCKNCKYFSICENILDVESAKIANETNVIIFNNCKIFGEKNENIQ